MREIAPDIARWFDEGHAVALAQVIKTWGSSPRVAGSVMAVSDDARLAGSVSGGCIEGAVARGALDCLVAGSGTVEEFHASTRRAQEVGLSCGGNVDVLVAPLDRALFEMEAALIEADREYVRVGLVGTDAAGEEGVASVVPGTLAFSRKSGVGLSFLVAFSLDAEVALEAAGRRADLSSLRLVDVPGDSACCVIIDDESFEGAGVSEDGLAMAAAEILALPRTVATGQVVHADRRWFFARCSAKPQLVCIGGTHVSIHLAQMAKMLGYRTVVIDPRGVFATEERFPFVDELVHEWPQEAFGHIELTSQTALCALTHDPKIDVPALARALESPAFYIGSLGRSTTQLSRYQELAALGYPDEVIGRVFGPIGLDLRGREPAEIALSIMAEITAVRHGAPCAMSTMVGSARKALAPARLA